MTNPAHGEDLETRLAAILGKAPHDVADEHHEPHAETPHAAEDIAHPAEHHAEPPHAEAEHAETPIFALVAAPAEEPAAASPPHHDHAIEQAAEPVVHQVAEPAIDLTPVAAAMAASAAELVVPRMELAEPAPHHDAPIHREELPPPVAEAKSTPSDALEIGTATAIPGAADVVKRRRGSIIGGTVSLLSKLVPYSLVAIVLRLVMARLFFIHGQAKIDGPSYLISSQDLMGWPGVHFVVTLPMMVKEQTYATFAQMPHLPIPSWIAAMASSYAEFILPICLLLGFATRFAALAFLIMTVIIQVFVTPEALWSTHVYWAAILLVLISLGPGVVSIDAMIRHFHRK